MIRTVRKAVLAGLFAAAGALGTALLGGADLVRPTLLLALGAGLVTAATVWRVPNAKADPGVEHEPEHAAE